MGVVLYKGHTFYVYGAAATLLIACHLATKTAGRGPGHLVVSHVRKTCFLCKRGTKKSRPNPFFVYLIEKDFFNPRPKSDRGK